MAELKSVNNTLERLGIWFICQGKSHSIKLYTRLNDDYFGNKINLAAFKRIKLMLKRNNEVMSWEDLCEDTTFPETSRLLFKNFSKTTDVTKKRCDEIFNRLDELRKIRIVYSGTKAAIEDKLINADSLDIEEVIDDLASVVARARTQDQDDDFYIFGKGGNTDEIVEDVLEKGIPCMPTGISRWDSVNGGIPFSSVMLLGADSGGGKSLAADCIANTVAEWGAKTCFVSLEMDINELTVRHLARNSSIDQGKIFTNSKLGIKDKEKIREDYKAKQKRWAKLGRSIYYKIPKNNPTMEQLLLSLKPYDFRLIVIDYISLLKGMNGDNQWQKLIDGVNYAKTFARSTGCTVVILVQITKEQTLKYAKGMIDGADLAWFWTKDQSVLDTGVINIHTEKARKQKAFDFPVKAEYEFARISNVADDYKPPKPKDLVNKELKNKVDSKSSANNNKPKSKNDSLMKEFFGSDKKKAA